MTDTFYLALGACRAIIATMKRDHGLGSDVAYDALTIGTMPTDDFIRAAQWYADKAAERDDEANAKKFRACIHIAEYVRDR